jgi:hypothetical protein
MEFCAPEWLSTKSFVVGCIPGLATISADCEDEASSLSAEFSPPTNPGFIGGRRLGSGVNSSPVPWWLVVTTCEDG